jgi:PAS domain S-box-containing protein
MTEHDDRQKTSFELRRRAEALLGKRMPEPEDVSELSPMEIQQLVHELRVHQIELEMQNEELRRAQDLLSESRDGYSDLYDFAPVGYFTLDSHGLILEVNLAGATLLGSARSLLTGKPFQSFLRKEYADTFHLHTQEVLATRARQRCEIKLWKSDGSSFDAQLDSLAVEDTQRRETRCRTIVTDITDRKQMEETREKLEAQLRQAQKLEAIGTLAGGIAHDFNNILAAILGYSEIALEHLRKGIPVRHDLEQILKAACRAKDLVQRILIFSRPGSVQERRPIEIGPIIKEVLQMLKATLPATIELRQDICDTGGAVMADPTQIHQVVVNLCSNAAFAMLEHGGVLEVVLTNMVLHSDMTGLYADLKPGHYVRLTVRDTGKGMDPATLERIFDPYFTTKAAGEGSGLGLPTVHGIVKRHEGAITVVSEPGKGTAFHVLLPRAETAQEAKAHTLAPLPRGTERILFVDDEEALVTMSREILSDLGYEVTTSVKGREALDLFRRQPDAFDLVITDYTMPHVTGADLAKEILRIRADIPIVLCSGHGQRIDQEDVKNMGFSGFVMKPFTMRNLSDAICKALGKGEVRAT